MEDAEGHHVGIGILFDPGRRKSVGLARGRTSPAVNLEGMCTQAFRIDAARGENHHSSKTSLTRKLQGFDECRSP
jgi:hypothetical protein